MHTFPRTCAGWTRSRPAPTWKKTFGFHPLAAFADHGAAGNGEPLAIMLRTGGAGSNTAADHIETTRLALAQLPRGQRRRVLVRTDSAGGTHSFLEWLTAPSRRLHYSVGVTVAEDTQAAILKVPADSWTPAYDGDGRVRDGAWVADITGCWTCRPGRPGCGSSSARNGGTRGAAAVHRHRRAPVHRVHHRRQERPAADLELRHRRRARCEDRIRNAKDTGLRNLPLKGFAQNQLWCEIVSLACELLAWTQMLALTGTARRWEPKRLRLRLFSAAGRLARGGRRSLRLAERWPWARQITTAVTRLQAIPSGWPSETIPATPKEQPWGQWNPAHPARQPGSR